VPLHLNGEAIKEMEPSASDIASLRYQHWISMMQRNPKGFRCDRTSKHNKAPNPLAMILNGVRLIARHGDKTPGSAFR
jgi:hypothetical protein